MTDVEQIRAVLRDSYAAISGPRGQRDWDAHASHFAPDARSVVVHRDGNAERIETMSPAQYRDSRDPFFRSHSFWETETRADVIVEGDLAVVMSHYESRWDPAEAPFETGVNSVQLARIGGEWKIVSIMWTAGMAARRVGELAGVSA